MAKRGTLDHPKTLSLARALKVEPWSALGLLEAVWHWAGRYRPTGNLTGVEPRDIGDGIRARKNPQKLLNALIQERWIDKVDDSLYIHDWPDHADDATKKSLERSNREFDPYYQTESRLKSGTVSRQSLDTVETKSASRARAPEGQGKEGQGKASSGKVQEGGGPIFSHESPLQHSRLNSKAEADEEIVQWIVKDFWPIYWRKTDKAGAIASAKKHCRTPEVRTAAVAGVKQQTGEMMSREEKHRPHAATWINHHRWEDEPQLPGIDQPSNGRPQPPAYKSPLLPGEDGEKLRAEFDEWHKGLPPIGKKLPGVGV